MIVPLPVLVALLGVAGPTRQSTDQTEAPPDVRVELLADVTRVVPGATFHVAVRLEIGAEHWHVYWENPGDSGLATQVTVDAPEGFAVGPVRYPAPRRFETGGLVTYGYEGAAVLFVPVTAPAELDATTVELSASARWLVCKRACFLGSGEAQLALPVGERAEPANAAALEPFRRRLPRPWTELEGAGAVWRGDPHEGKLRLDVGVPEAEELELFPLYDPVLELAAARVGGASSARTLQITWRVRPDGSRPITARGVLRVRRAGVDRFYAVDLPLAAQPEPGR